MAPTFDLPSVVSREGRIVFIPIRHPTVHEKKFEVQGRYAVLAEVLDELLPKCVALAMETVESVEADGLIKDVLRKIDGGGGGGALMEKYYSILKLVGHIRGKIEGELKEDYEYSETVERRFNDMLETKAIEKGVDLALCDIATIGDSLEVLRLANVKGVVEKIYEYRELVTALQLKMLVRCYARKMKSPIVAYWGHPGHCKAVERYVKLPNAEIKKRLKRMHPLAKKYNLLAREPVVFPFGSLDAKERTGLLKLYETGGKYIARDLDEALAIGRAKQRIRKVEERAAERHSKLAKKRKKRK